MGRVCATLTVGETVISIRSPTIAAKLEADKATIAALKKALQDTNAESARLRVELETVYRRRWWRLGRLLRFVRYEITGTEAR